MRSFAAGLVALLAFPALVIAAVDPAEREAALRYERAVQAGNQQLREANKQADAILAGLLSSKAPSEKEVGDAIDALQKGVKDFQNRLKETPPPLGTEAKAYSVSVLVYLSVLEKYTKENFLAALKTIEKPTGNPEQDLAALKPLVKLARGTKTATQGIRNTRPNFLAAYEISPADLGRAPAAVAANPVTRPATSTEIGSPSPPAAQSAGSPATVSPTPATGPAALDQAIRDGEAAFQASVKEVQYRLLPKLLLGGDIGKEEIEKTFAGINGGISKFEASLAAVTVPDDTESKAYFAAAQNLLAATKKIDFAAIGTLLIDTSVPPEEKQKQLIDKLKGMEAGIKKDYSAYKSAQQAFRTKHDIAPPDAPLAVAPGAAAATTAAETPASPEATEPTPPGPTLPPPSSTDLPAPTSSPMPPGTATVPAAEPAIPLTGPAALDKAIRDGEKAFRDSTQALQTNLLAKVTSGGQIEPAEIQQGFAGVTAGIAKFEEQLASVEIPDDPESKAYVAAAKKLIANLKKADFAGLARILTNKNLTADARQNQLTKKVGGLTAGMERDLATFEKARKAFLDKHKLTANGGTHGSMPTTTIPGETMP